MILEIFLACANFFMSHMDLFTRARVSDFIFEALRNGAQWIVR